MGDIGRIRRGQQLHAQPPLIGLGKVDVHQLVVLSFVERMFTSPGIINDLMRDH